jgi:xanthine dehydrogenase accessory factor
VKREIMQETYDKLKSKSCASILFEADGNKYLRKWCPGERLIILGGGHIAQPLCRLGDMLDFEVTVVDDRPLYANSARFPGAKTVICNSFENAIDDICIRSSDYVCIVTRGHRYDGACLRKILKADEDFPYYLGMIGSRRRVGELKELLINEGYDSTLLDKLNAPIGLSIGAQTVEEIAVSIAAQLVEYRRQAVAESEYLSMQNVDESVLEALSSDEGWVLALVLATKGSTPVKDGAIMAVNSLGQTRGTVGGGCSEAEIINIARNMANKNEKRVVTVDMTNDVAEQEGMVCGGTMRVLIESVE